MTAPAAAALMATPTLPEAPARRLAGEVSVRRESAEVATTSRLSWKAAEVVTVLVTARLPAEERTPTRTLPRASAEAAVAVA